MLITVASLPISSERLLHVARALLTSFTRLGSFEIDVNRGKNVNVPSVAVSVSKSVSSLGISDITTSSFLYDALGVIGDWLGWGVAVLSKTISFFVDDDTTVWCCFPDGSI